MKLINYILTIIPVISLLGCEKDLKPYNEETNRLNFVYEALYQADTLIRRTFFYDPETKIFDTVWLKVGTMGYVTNENRPFALKQVVNEGDNDPQAEAGVHYLAFDDPEVSEFYKIPAGQNKTSFPVILKRDASLKKQAYTLRIRIAANEYFQTGYSGLQEKIIVVADTLSRPELWNSHIVRYWGGEYGLEKHRFMIRATAGMGIIINDDFLRPMAVAKVDFSMTTYWYNFFTTKLAEENAERAKNGLGPLREAPDPVNHPEAPEGILVEFVKY